MPRDEGVRAVESRGGIECGRNADDADTNFPPRLRRSKTEHSGKKRNDCERNHGIPAPRHRVFYSAELVMLPTRFANKSK